MVFTSGAGMSVCGPMVSPSSTTKRRVMRGSSLRLSFFGSQMIPPFAPPKGMSATAHFQVIHEASARTSSALTSG